MPARVGKSWGAAKARVLRKAALADPTPLPRHVTPYEPDEVPGRSKFGNRRVEVDGVKFDSAKESRRWAELKLLERGGAIKDLRRQVTYRLEVNGHHVTSYRADFDYLEPITVPGLMGPAGAMLHVTEDVKGGEATITDAFRIKAALFKAIHGREIRIT